MMPRMVGPRHQFKVLNAVVGLVSIPMVDNFVPTQRAAKMALHDNAVLAAASICPVMLRAERDVPAAVMRLAAAIVPMVRAVSAHCLPLEATATLRGAFSQRPSFNDLCFAAIALASPIMKFASLFGVSNDDEPPKSDAGQVWNPVCATVSCVGF